MENACDYCGKTFSFLYPAPNEDGSEDFLCERCFDPIAEKLTSSDDF